MKQQPITLSTIIHPNPALITSQVGDELVMMDIEQGNYYGLNPVASRIWQLIGRESHISDVCAQVGKIYDVDPDVCTAEVIALVGRMRDQGMVEISG